MKKLFLLLFLGLLAFVFLYRQRVFLRDPIASVMRDGVKQTEAKVMINFTNDILLDDADGGKHRIYIVQNWNRIAGFPAGEKCIYGVACMMDSGQVEAAPVQVGSRGKRPAFEGVTMTSKRVEFVDEDGALVAVTLRP